MKKCPYCAEEIQDEAIKCKHCGEFISKRCPYCAEEIQGEALKCNHCGEWLTEKPLQHHLIASKDSLRTFYDKVFALLKEYYKILLQNIEAYKNKKPKSLYAGFWKRFFAVIIDSFILSSILILPYVLLLAILGGLKTTSDDIGLIIYVLINIINLFYFAIMESSSKQGTFGKLVLGIKITNLEGGRISFGNALWRNFGKIFSLLTIGIGYAMAGYTKKKQTFHDMIANCLVVNKSFINQPKTP